VALINTLSLMELVSDALASRKQKEAETNAKMVDLFKDALDEIKNCRMFLGVPRHYARRSYSCWCTACSRVRGRGHGSNSCGPNLMVQGCTRTKQTFWTESEFTVTASSGIRDRDVRVAEIVARELEKAKPDKWACVQARELWSPQEERQVRPGHFWLMKFGKIPGTNSCVEKKFQVGRPQVRGVQGGALWER
jgi:hypothetical protein